MPPLMTVEPLLSVVSDASAVRVPTPLSVVVPPVTMFSACAPFTGPPNVMFPSPLLVSVVSGAERDGIVVGLRAGRRDAAAIDRGRARGVSGERLQRRRADRAAEHGGPGAVDGERLRARGRGVDCRESDIAVRSGARGRQHGRGGELDGIAIGLRARGGDGAAELGGPAIAGRQVADAAEACIECGRGGEVQREIEAAAAHARREGRRPCQ